MRFNLARPIIHSLECMGVCEVEYDNYCIAVLIVESKKGPKFFLPGSVPDVYRNTFSFGVLSVEAVIAGP